MDEDAGIDNVEYSLATYGVLPCVRYFYAPVRTIVCQGCVDENRRMAMPDEAEMEFEAFYNRKAMELLNII